LAGTRWRKRFLTNVAKLASSAHKLSEKRKHAGEGRMRPARSEKARPGNRIVRCLAGHVQESAPVA
jgi:hypothetical protein